MVVTRNQCLMLTQEIEYRINSRKARMMELMEANDLENDAFNDLTYDPEINEAQLLDLNFRVNWRKKRILELESENEFDILAQRGLGSQKRERKGKGKEKDDSEHVLREAFFGKRQAGF